MKKLSAFIITIILLLIGIIIAFRSYILLIVYAAILLIMELSSYILITRLRKSFKWLITPKDELPVLDKDGVNKFFQHGYDPELGWVRKPNTKKDEIGKFGTTTYNIGPDGARKNPGHENLPKNISFYGDSFAFCRQNNDEETFEWYLSELTKTNVQNFGVGNYGLDQSLLRLKREYPDNKTKIVAIAVVPSTIVRVLCVWKHYNEFGNTFGFKPRYVLEKDKLKLIKNIIDSKDKFLNYRDYLPEIRRHDYFYKNKFKKDMIRFPYLLSILSDPLRNIPLISSVLWNALIKKEKMVGGYLPSMKKIMNINLKLRYNLFMKDRSAVMLLKAIVKDFADYGKKNGFKPILVWMPQKDDILFIRKHKKVYYQDFIDDITAYLDIIDLTPLMLKHNNLDKLYSDDNKYGGHYSRYGNKLVADILSDYLKKKKLL